MSAEETLRLLWLRLFCFFPPSSYPTPPSMPSLLISTLSSTQENGGWFLLIHLASSALFNIDPHCRLQQLPALNDQGARGSPERRLQPVHVPLPHAQKQQAILSHGDNLLQWQYDHDENDRNHYRLRARGRKECSLGVLHVISHSYKGCQSRTNINIGSYYEYLKTVLWLSHDPD
jgi:hypothetical protein